MTFSIAARCPETGMFGVAVCSSSPAVAARCAFVRAGVGAALSQNVTDPALGQRLLDRLGQGLSAEAAIRETITQEPYRAFRQLVAIGADGPPAAYSGAHMLGANAIASTEHAIAAGNLLADPQVPTVMVAAFDRAEGALGQRILAAMVAGRDSGGEAGPVHSAGLMLADTLTWPIADLRVDWTDADPIAALEALWQRYRPQMAAYVQRAIAPDAAPSYGVPGDER